MTIIVTANQTFHTSLEPDTLDGGGSHDHTNVTLNDTKLIDGQLHLKNDPPPNDKFIICEQDEEVFTVEKDGFVQCKSLLAETGIETIDDGAIVWKPSNDRYFTNWQTRCDRRFHCWFDGWYIPQAHT